MGTTYIAGIGWGIVSTEDQEKLRKIIRSLQQELPLDSPYREHYSYDEQRPDIRSFLEFSHKDTIVAEFIGNLQWDGGETGIFAKSSHMYAYDFEDLSFDALPEIKAEERTVVEKYANLLGEQPKWHIYMYAG